MPVIPELCLPDPEAARKVLAEVFGFTQDDQVMRLGDQAVAVVAGPAAGHGVIDHLALAVPDVDAAARDLMARGAVADPAVTPAGPLEIPEFWAGGVRYLFLQGPGSARIELISNLAAPRGPGHDHIGIPCRDISATAVFLQGLGAVETARFTLRRPDGDTSVRFLALQGAMLELYQPPALRPAAGQGLWRRLRIGGVRPATGPDGLTVCPA